LTNGYERHETLEDNHPNIQLQDEWLAPGEIAERQELRDRREIRRRELQREHEALNLPDVPEPVLVPRRQVQVPEIELIPIEQVPEEEQDPEGILVPEGERIDIVPDEGQADGSDDDNEIGPMHGPFTRKSTRPRKPRFTGEEWANYQSGPNPKQKIRAGCINDAFLHQLYWDKAIETIKSRDLLTFVGMSNCHVDWETSTVEWMHPYA
jgi:hypothetical protein